MMIFRSALVLMLLGTACNQHHPTAEPGVGPHSGKGKTEIDAMDKTSPAITIHKVPDKFANDDWLNLLINHQNIPKKTSGSNLVISFATKEIEGKVRRIEVVMGNLLKEPVEAIVNAANSTLIGSAGVAKAIQDGAGQEPFKKEVKAYFDRHHINSFPVGGAMAMPSFGLLEKGIKLIINTVGPETKSPSEKNREELYSAIYNSMMKASEYKMKSLATVAISTGIFNFPKDIASELYFKAALQFFHDHPETSIEVIRFTNSNEDTVKPVYDGFNRAIPYV